MNNSKLFVSAICVLGLTLAAPLSTEAGRGGGGRGGGGGSYASAARGGSFARGGYAAGDMPGVGTPAVDMPGVAYARAGMGPSGARWNGANRTGNWNGGRNWNGANNGRNWSGRNNWNGNNWHGNNWHGNNWHNGHNHNGNDVVFIGSFGFPWWWGWGPSWGWDYGYPYGYYPYGYGGAYGYGYGYGGVTRMVMATGIIMDTATDTAPSTSLTTETPADPESPSCNGGCHALAITMDPLTESWGRKRGAQSGRTSKTTITQVNRRHSGHADRSRSSNNLSVDWPAVSQGERGANRRSPFLQRARGTVPAYNRVGCCAWGYSPPFLCCSLQQFSVKQLRGSRFPPSRSKNTIIRQRSRRRY